MAVREILLYPDPALKAVCAPANPADPGDAEAARDLVETMQASPGVGLAAPQIGVLKRITAIDTSRVKRGKSHGLLVLFNPEIVFKEGEKIYREGCLSVPQYLANVRRARRVVVRATDAEGQPLEVAASGFEALALQHEIDHLDGILFIDRVACLKTDLFCRGGD